MEPKVATEDVRKSVFFEEDGFTTVGVVVALLLTLSLIFTGAKVYEVETTAARIQEVADVTALAAENTVAEFYLVAHMCDAVVLSLSLTGLIVTGVGVAAVCVPPAASVGLRLVETGKKITDARNKFAQRCAAGLNKYQETLPFQAAASSAAVARSNDTARGENYGGMGILLPVSGEEIRIGEAAAASEAVDSAERKKDELVEKARKAEEAAQAANEAKLRGYAHDCGENPGYCMYERAGHLAGLSGADNPFYGSVDTWSFSVALSRAKAYYPARLATEQPTGTSVEEVADSELRKRFYTFAVKEVQAGYVHDDPNGGFEASFPLLPKNTEEMRATELFTEVRYPVTKADGGAETVHAWTGCPNAAGAVGLTSIAQMEAGHFEICPLCQFRASSMGSVASASTSIDNGFEYHYNQVARAAQDYQREREKFEPQAQAVRGDVESIYDQLKSAFSEAVNHRITVHPPGRYGSVALVVSTSSVDIGFDSSFVSGEDSLGGRAAISAATLVEDAGEEGDNIMASLLDGLAVEGEMQGVAAGLDGVLELWGTILSSYTKGNEGISNGLEKMFSSIPLSGASGLGRWASQKFESLVASVGLQPAIIKAFKPVVVNSGHVLGADNSSFSVKLLDAKRTAASLTGSNVFEGAVDALERKALESVAGLEGDFTIASIEILGEGGPSIPLTITLPQSVTDAGRGLIGDIAASLRDVAASVTGVRQWK